MTYDEFIDTIIKTRGQWNIPKTAYYEAHHILPRCLGGQPKIPTVHYSKHKNIIWLYPEEHYEAHRLLVLKYPNNLAILRAWNAMHFRQSEMSNLLVHVSAEEYVRLKTEYAKRQSLAYTGKNNPNFGKKATLEQKKHYSIVYKHSVGVQQSSRFSGQHHSIAAKQKIKERLVGKYVWINDGKSELLIENSSIIPTGYTLGRLSTACTKKQVLCCELNRVFPSVSAAVKELNLAKSARAHISLCCNGQQKIAYGYHWQFI